jgi:nitroreductase
MRKDNMEKNKDMNPVIETILKRRSVRAYEEKQISPKVRQELLQATLRAPTAGNLMLYSIVEVSDQKIKDRLAVTCDNQPFIARAPLVWLFLADYQRWYDYFVHCGVEEICREKDTPMRPPQEGDLFLACCDALIAAQTAVIAAEGLGLGSCYIGDIMENYEIHKEMFTLPQYVFPICLLCFGYPTEQQLQREMTLRYDQKYILFENKYRQLKGDDFDGMFSSQQEQAFHGRDEVLGARNLGQLIYTRKFNADFSKEMTRSVRAILNNWIN